MRILLLVVLVAGASAFAPAARFAKSSRVMTKPSHKGPSALPMAATPVSVFPATQSRLGQLFAASPVPGKVVVGGLAILVAFYTWFQKVIWTASRTYDRDANSVGREYDAWTEEGILEYYWGEHIHLGYYNKDERDKGYLRKNFIQAKYDFIDEMADWGEISKLKPEKVLDVGCGIGGTSRYLAKKFGEGTTVTGITLASTSR